MNIGRPPKIVRESSVEAYLVKRCKEIGALCEKFTSPQRKNVPDRLVTFWGTYYLEMKRPGKGASEAQARDHKRRRALGADVRVIDTHAKVDSFIAELLAKDERPADGIKGPWEVQLLNTMQEFIEVSENCVWVD
jgi:hypothetical protein